jgi:Na+-translocating ferredoxin:NAD+ oxidoreductase RnfG subunit
LVLGARSRAALDLDPSHLAQRYTAMRPRQPRITRESFESLLDPRRVQRADSLVDSLRRDPAVEASRLDRPLALFHNLLVRAEQESEALTHLLETLRHTGGVLWVPLALLAVFPLAGVALQRRPAETGRSAALAVLAAGGAIGMGLDLLLLHLYQGRFGTLYLEVGWLFGLWMGGLALGGYAGRHLCARRGPFVVGLSAVVCLAVAAALVAAAGGSVAYGRVLAATSFAAAGALCGVLIPVAEALLATAGVVGARAGIGIEAADHLGGAVCALVLGVLVIPIVGLAHAAWLVMGLAMFAAACLAIALVRKRALLPAALERRLEDATRYQSFPYRRTMLWLLAVAAASVIGHATVYHVLLGPRIHLDESLLAESRLAPPWREESDPCVHYRSEAPDDRGLALASRAAAPRVQGYGGPLGVLVTADAKGRIRRVAFLEHSETPSYVEAADDFFSALEGRSLLEPIEVRSSLPGLEPSDTDRRDPSSAQSVDAITGATVTSRAVARALEASGLLLAEPIFGRPYAGDGRAGQLGEPRHLYLAASLLLLPAVFLFGGRWLRRAWLTLHALVGGLWLGVQLSTVQVLAWLRLEPETSLLTFTGLLAAVVALAALVGPLYCGYLCPAGALQELLGHAGRARRLAAELDRLARFVKYVLLAALVTGSLAFGSQAILRLDLLRELWAEERSAMGIALLALVAAGSLLAPRFGCRYLCPTGALLNLLGKLAPLRRLLPAKKYTHCDFGVRGAPDVDCLQCNRCLVGERAGAASVWRASTARAALLASLLLLALFALPPGEGAEVAASLEPQVRSVDVARAKALTAAGRLSDKRADYWHVVRKKE